MSNRTRKILKKKGIRPLKRLGQSFLEDQNVIEKIVKAADLQKEDVVVEIGAGLGFMTDLIAKKAGRVLALEIDSYMISILKQTLDGRANIEIVQSDVLKYDLSAVCKERPSKKIKIIGNIPYNISSQILFHLLYYRKYIDSIVIMFQKEMADRILAEPGTKEYGIPTVFVRMYAAVSQELIIPATCFYPPPKVSSAVLRFILREKPVVELADESIFMKVVKAAFSTRRKTLLNNLRNSDLLDHSEVQTRLLFEMTKIDERRRAETLSVEEFAKLSNALGKLKTYQP